MQEVTKDGVQNCTLDITLFFMIVRGLDMAEAAALQNLRPEVLEEHLKANEGSLLYEKLKRYYTALRRKRDERKPKGKAV
jgi:hypothetical protein